MGLARCVAVGLIIVVAVPFALLLASPPRIGGGLSTEQSAAGWKAWREAKLELALFWLWRQQEADGLLRADSHARLRRGESVTAAALLATSFCGEEHQRPHRAKIVTALNALVNGSERDAAVDYPSYTTACLLEAVVRLRPAGWQALARGLLDRLRTLQLSPGNDWRPDQPAFGGFGLGDGPPRDPEAASLVTLSTTVAAVAAARAAGVPAADPLVKHALLFVERCQNFGPGDGGFFGAPTDEWRGGKGGRDQAGRKRSYGTATADGLRGLLLCEATKPRIDAARRWLDENLQPEVPGLLSDFEPSLRLYWTAALATTEVRARWLEDQAWLEARQREDGAFVGFAGAMKEDEPVVATILMIRALATH